MQRHFFSTLHPLSPVIFAAATVVAFVLLHNSRFNFHCYTQREATPTRNWPGSDAATSRDFLRERLQRAFIRASLNRPIEVPYIIIIAGMKKKTKQKQKRSISFFTTINVKNIQICMVLVTFLIMIYLVIYTVTPSVIYYDLHSNTCSD